MKDLVSDGARVVGRNMLIYFTIGRIALGKLDSEGLENVYEMAETAIRNYSIPSAPNARFSLPMEVGAGSSTQSRTAGMMRGASGYLRRDDKYFIKESQ